MSRSTEQPGTRLELDLYEAGLDYPADHRTATITTQRDGHGSLVRISNGPSTWRYRVDEEGNAERITPTNVVVIPPWVRAALEHANVDVDLEEQP